MNVDPPRNETPWSIGRLIQWTSEHFTRRGVDDPRLSCEVLLAHAAGCRRIDLYARFDEVLDEATTTTFRELLKRAAEHEPIAYLVGKKEFFSLEMTVTRDVLIPRSETELVVECILDHCRARGLDAPEVLDIGTGSGCIAVAVLAQIQAARATATDISSEALEVARGNAERHGVADRLSLIQADCLDLHADAVPATGFDVLVSNPPYIPSVDMAGLDRNVRAYEPKVALTDGQDGLSFYRSIATDGAGMLSPDGVVVVEAADGCAEEVKRAFVDLGDWTHGRTLTDRTIGMQRVLMFARGKGERQGAEDTGRKQP